MHRETMNECSPFDLTSTVAFDVPLIPPVFLKRNFSPIKERPSTFPPPWHSSAIPSILEQLLSHTGELTGQMLALGCLSKWTGSLGVDF